MADLHFEPQPFGKYLLITRIGAGGMAEIFRARAFGVEGFTKELCIKRILPTLSSDETFTKMFIDEAKLAVNLHHANIVQVFDLGRIGEHYFIAMELVRGTDLLQIINRCRAHKIRVPVPLALHILADVCKGLDYAHRLKIDGRPAGLIHRDVSPSNILVSWEGEVKVADFGIAKATLQDEKTATGTMKGKHGYMSPEQVKGEPYDRRSDVFAAGILLWETLSGRRLFKGETDLETLERVKSAQIPGPPSQQNQTVSQAIDRITLKALALHPQNRFQTAAEFQDALLDCLFATGERVDTKTLAAFMHEYFAEEIKGDEELSHQQIPPNLPLALQLSDTEAIGMAFGGNTPSQRFVSPHPPVGTNPTGLEPQLTRSDLPPGAQLVKPSRHLSRLVLIIWVAAAVLALVGGGFGLSLLLSQRPDTRSMEPVPAPLPSSAPKRGTLSVASLPSGAQIRMDGAPTGKTTPAFLTELERSQIHKLVLTHEGFQEWSKEIAFGPMEMVAIEAQLQPVPGSEETHEPPGPAVLPPRPRSSLGTLNVNSLPVWAYIYINDQKQDRPTPLYNLKLKPGEYLVRVENPKQQLSKTEKIVIKDGETINLVVNLKP